MSALLRELFGDPPVIVDADTGYGKCSPHHSKDSSDLIRTGDGGMLLEDQLWPKRVLLRCRYSRLQTSRLPREAPKPEFARNAAIRARAKKVEVN
ncbi:MAG TPA: hypothetical protein VGW77_18740 [Candidatus Binatia bacterium]|nr:hypothetical protein [Candidatus Binatia bacterium]